MSRRRTGPATSRLLSGLLVSLYGVFCASLVSCAKRETLSAPLVDLSAPENYTRLSLPPQYTAAVLGAMNTPADNPVTDAGATLGRVIFYDPQIAVGNRVSCASCHVQAQGFGVSDRFSAGFRGELGTFHSMRLANAAFYLGAGFFWDQRAPTLEAQVTQPIVSSVEMGWDADHGGMPALLRKMERISYYPGMFAEVFGDSAISEDRISRALAQFIRSMVSVGSRFDVAYAQVFDTRLADRGLSLSFPGFTTEENRGKELFVSAQLHSTPCARCHVPPTFALAANSRSNGLDAGETRLFKAPALKNLADGLPMMHDGRFSTLSQVVTHYVSGIQNGPAVDARLRNAQGRSIYSDLTAGDQAALVAFMKTLSDPAIQTDSRFSSPF